MPIKYLDAYESETLLGGGGGEGGTSGPEVLMVLSYFQSNFLMEPANVYRSGCDYKCSMSHGRWQTRKRFGDFVR